MVDVLRSCYSVDMAFYADDPTRLTRVNWYFTDFGEVVPYNHAFASQVYAIKDEVEPTVGERYSPRPWRGGESPYPVSKGGLCGTPEQWAKGSQTNDPLPLLWPDTNVPRCCNPPVPLGIGGTASGGSSSGIAAVGGGMGSGGSGSSSSGLVTACANGDVLPPQLKGTWSDDGGCACLDGFTALFSATNTCPIIDGSNLGWHYLWTDCRGAQHNMWIQCAPISLVWYLSIDNVSIGLLQEVLLSGGYPPLDLNVFVTSQPGQDFCLAFTGTFGFRVTLP